MLSNAITVPIETCLHAHRTLARIRDLGLAAGVSLLPGSALTKLEYVLGMIDHVVVPARDFTAVLDAPVPAAAFDRVRILRENLDYHESKAIVHVEGRLTAADAARLAAAGATRIVVVMRPGANFLGASLRGVSRPAALTAFAGNARQILRGDRDLPTKAGVGADVFQLAARGRVSVQLRLDGRAVAGRPVLVFGRPDGRCLHHQGFAIGIELVGHGYAPLHDRLGTSRCRRPGAAT